MNTTARWRIVFFDDRQSDDNHDGDEIRQFGLSMSGEWRDYPVGRYRIHDLKPLEEPAKRISADRRLELIRRSNAHRKAQTQEIARMTKPLSRCRAVWPGDHSFYSRAQAVADGAQVDVTMIA